MKSERYLSEREYRAIRNLRKEKVPKCVIARSFGINKRHVSRITNTNIDARKPCGGRKPTTSKSDDKNIRIMLKKFHDQPLPMIQQVHIPKFSLKIIRRVMRDSQLKQQKATTKLFLSERHRQLRLAFAKEYQDKSAGFWRSIYYADESLIRDSHTRNSYFVICGPFFPKMYAKIHPIFKHPRQLFIWCAIKAGEPVKWTKIDGFMDSTVFINTAKEAFGCYARRRHNTTKQCSLSYLKEGEFTSLLFN